MSIYCHSCWVENANHFRSRIGGSSADPDSSWRFPFTDGISHGISYGIITCFFTIHLWKPPFMRNLSHGLTLIKL